MEKAEKFLSRQVEIEARYWDGSQQQAGEIIEWVEANGGIAKYVEPNESGVHQAQIRVHTLEGIMAALEDFWIIRGTEGEFYPCKSSVFDRKYEKVS